MRKQKYHEQYENECHNLLHVLGKAPSSITGMNCSTFNLSFQTDLQTVLVK